MIRIMKYEKVIIYFCSFLLFIIIFCGSFSYIVNNKYFFHNEYQKNNVYQNVAITKNMNIEESKSYVDNVTINVFNFLKNKEDLKYFNEKEKSHMHDVKTVIFIIKLIYYSSTFLFFLFLFIIYLRFKKNKLLFVENISKVLLYSSSISIVFLLVLFLWSVFSFETLFILMHLLIFPQGNWMFPSDSLLIMLFPQNLFFNIGIKIFIYAMFQSIIFFIIGHWLRKQIKVYKNILKNN